MDLIYRPLFPPGRPLGRGPSGRIVEMCYAYGDHIAPAPNTRYRR